ncbi:MAG: hypothetical protein GWP91_21610, partial [Rhodobacterales bacterium]|nr:hypothetical protein [Rhodobacterales bacterium]
GPALAQDCDANQLAQDINDASPVAVPRVFLKLVECDEAVAVTSAPLAMSKTLHGEEGNRALLACLKIGAQTSAQDWIDSLEPDHRSQSILWIGEQCDDVSAIGDFFVDSAKGDMAEVFLKERWYRGMSHCKLPAVQDLLRAMVETPDKATTKEQLFGYMEVYARNLGAAAVPYLKKFTSEQTDVKEQQLALNAFSDAANVGSMSGMDMKAAEASIAAIHDLGPNLAPSATSQARDTLLALGDEAGADSFAKYRWPERMQDGNYLYGVYAKEIATCKKEKMQGVFHYGIFTEPGAEWPDALEMDIEGKATAAWGLELAEKCGGEGTVTIRITPEPLETPEALEEWVKAHITTFNGETTDFHKAEISLEETTAY